MKRRKRRRDLAQAESAVSSWVVERNRAAADGDVRMDGKSKSRMVKKRR